jgi:hypothetical protein
MSEPVFLPESLARAASMTFLRHANRCMRSGFLYAKHRRSGVQSANMMRGSAAHAIHERATKAMLSQAELELPPEVAKAIVNEVLAEYPVPVEEHDYLREYAHRWASQWRLREEERVVAVERLFELELAGWTVRCKVDFASADEENRVYVADYKSGRGALPYDEIARRRPDGPMATKAFQLIVYVLAVVFGRPVDGEQVARGCQEAIAEYVYPGIETADGLMLRRTTGMTRLAMLEYRESLATLLARVAEAERTGEWPAVVSDAACGECPCMAECPIPSELRDFHGEVNTLEQAQDALALSHVRTQRERALRRELRAFSEARGGAPIRYGNRVAEFVPRESETVKDKQGFYEALAGGMPIEDAREKYVRVSQGTSFADRDLTDAEITAASESSAPEDVGPPPADSPPSPSGESVDGSLAAEVS